MSALTRNMKKTTTRKTTKKAKSPEDILDIWMAEVLGQLGKIANGITGKKGEFYLDSIEKSLHDLAFISREYILGDLREIKGRLNAITVVVSNLQPKNETKKPEVPALEELEVVEDL